MEEVVFTSVKLTMMFAFVILNSLESFVKVSYLYMHFVDIIISTHQAYNRN